MVRGENRALSTGRFDSRNQSVLVETGRFIRSRDDLESLVVGVSEQRPVYLRQVAEVTDGRRKQRVTSGLAWVLEASVKRQM